MTQNNRLIRLAAACLAGTILIAPGLALAGPADAAATAYQDMGDTYGVVPGFFGLFPRDEVTEAWDAFAALELTPQGAMDAKTRELIGVAVATQGTCQSCVYFHAAAAIANGASMEEILAVAGAGVATQRLDAAFAAARLDGDLDAFKRETDLVLWGDATTIEARGTPADFCGLAIAGADVDYLGCD